jgi:hypothetical protein
VTASTRVSTALVAVALAVLPLAGCSGGGRSGTDQPGAQQPPVAAGRQVSVNESSEPDLAAALRRGDVDDPQRWARLLVANRPYPPGAAGEDQLRQLLQENGADPGEIDTISSLLEP